MNTEAQLYDSNNIDSLIWPDTIDGQYAKVYLVPLIKNTISHYIPNIQADIYVLKFNEMVLPILVTTENYSNSWVCSPYAHYISYGMEYSGLIGNRYLSALVKNFLNGFGKICQQGKINSVVYVNNWMFSTDLYPEGLHSDSLDAILTLLTRRFPQHAIIFRSLNQITTPDLMQPLAEKKFHLIASRYVYVTDSRKEAIFNTRILKSDLKLWKEHSHVVLTEKDLQLSDCDQLIDLHHEVYIFQRSLWQPDFNNTYVKMLFENKLLKFKVYRSEGVIKGVAGYFKRGNIMMCPIFGYHKNSSESNSIYRVLNTALLLEARQEGLLFNQSAGASFFKSIRRAEGCLEYIAVYTQHLPFYRQLVWSTLQLFFNTVGSKYMKKY